MGNCFRSSSRNEGISLEQNLVPLPDMHEKTELTESEVEMILKRVHMLAYSMRLYEKRNIQSKRAKLLSGNGNNPNNQYIKLVEDTKELENEILKEAKKKVLADCKVDPNVFEESEKLSDLKKINESIAQGLMEEIKGLRDKLGLNEDKVIELNKKFRTAYDQVNFSLSSYPDVGQRLSTLFETETYLACTDFLAADILYNDYKLLPIEILSFVED